MMRFLSVFSLTSATLAATLYLNLPARANSFQRLPETLIGGSVQENLDPAQLSTDLRGTLLEWAARDLNLSSSSLQIAAVQRILWNDGCRGQYLPGMLCTMALFPGWRVLLTDTQQQWIYTSTDLKIGEESEILPLPPDCLEAFALRRCNPSPGISQLNPILPDRREADWWIFENVPSRRWSDPPTDYGFQYVMTGGSLFAEIVDFPVGIDSDNLFQVAVGDRVLGEFRTGETVDFLSLLGTGVAEFTIAGIQSAIDVESPVAFPTRLAFDTPTASFKMRAIVPPQSVPEPRSAIALLGLGLLGIGLQQSRRFKK